MVLFPMTNEELKAAIEQTKEKIWDLRRRVDSAGNPAEKHALKRQLKELQILQLWHLDQLG